MSGSGNKKPMQGQDWSGEMGEKWNRNLDRFEGMIEPIGAVTLELAACRPGERVLDIGCGGGATSRQIARAVAPGGEVLGLDISPALIATSRELAQQEGLENAHFVCADAATATLEPADYDVLFSRFGVMFFADPKAAFTRLHAFLREGARAAFCCWGPPPENPWVARVIELLSRHIEIPEADPTAPGPFAFADQDRTRAILEQAGFHTIHFREWRGELLLGGPGLDAEAAADFSMKSFFVGEMLDGQPQSVIDAVLDELKALYREHQSDRGIELDGMSWLVTARA